MSESQKQFELSNKLTFNHGNVEVKLFLNLMAGDMFAIRAEDNGWAGHLGKVFSCTD